MKKVYLSVPVSIPWDTVRKLEDEILKPAGVNYKFWNRVMSDYSPETLDAADTVIFFLPKNGWSSRVDNLPSGLKKEYAKAYAGDKDIFIAYETINNGIQIYETSTDDNSLGAIAGTSFEFKIQWERDNPAKRIRSKEEEEWSEAFKTAHRGLYDFKSMSECSKIKYSSEESAHLRPDPMTATDRKIAEAFKDFHWTEKNPCSEMPLGEYKRTIKLADYRPKGSPIGQDRRLLFLM